MSDRFECVVVELDYAMYRLSATIAIGLATIITVSAVQLLLVVLIALNYISISTGSTLIAVSGISGIVVIRTLPHRIAKSRVRKEYGEKVDRCIP